MLALGFFCGLQRAEIVDLRVAHFDLDRERLVGFRRKSSNEGTFPTALPFASWQSDSLT